MRLQHLETLQPVCPVCRVEGGQSHLLMLAEVLKERDGHLVEGILHCGNVNCQREYPIIDGIPLIIRDLRRYLSENEFPVCRRTDFSPVIESLLGDCFGQSSSYNASRQQISSYAWDHFGDHDPAEVSGIPEPGSMLRVLHHGLEMADTTSFGSGPILDLGCSVGRSTFALAEEFDRPVLGIDLNFGMISMAGEVLRDGVVRYPRRRVGLVYDRREFPVLLDGAEHVDFWACDATALPFAENQFAAAISMNLLDCVHSPLEFLSSLAAVLQSGGAAVIACPYDWSVSATALEGWIGGHSQRGPDSGASEPALRRLLSPGNPQSLGKMQLIAEDDVDWQVRMHDRSFVAYKSHVVVARKVGVSDA